MKKIIIILGMFLALAAGTAYAQGSYSTISYSMGFATGELGDFIGKPSFRGVTFDYRKLVQPNVGVGVSLGWNVFYEALDYDTYTIENVSLSGKQYRYSNHFPMLFAADYYLKPGEAFNPFVGLGAGTIYTIRNTDMNLYTIERNAWHFALQPQIGFMYTMNDVAAFTVTGKYNYGFAAGDLNEAQSYFSLNVGFTFLQ
jgi:outer membrane protein W